MGRLPFQGSSSAPRSRSTAGAACNARSTLRSWTSRQRAPWPGHQPALIRIWGRIGTAGQQRIDWHDTKEAAEQACARLLQAKQRRGYRLRPGPG
jgi:predicted DNA-binding WGR domain protein